MIDRQAHPVRTALVTLLRERGTLTSTEAARELGGSSGLYSFHLRQLARYGVVEEVPAEGRAKPWRLVGEAPPLQSALNRGLEDESYQHWLAVRDRAPARWRRDQAFSEVVYLTPEELTELGNAVRALIAGYSGRPAHNRGPVAAVARFFPLVEPSD
ncbi:winged helix-turn-helix domain-containing protein [Dactylosporangium sp. CA-139114]|uniref:winged helix-turn-helix domain-containing protein n=1 Tax=Dactylosporangium sp. CA-139114 TaxID=3239931 RepID=UPI003D98FB82